MGWVLGVNDEYENGLGHEIEMSVMGCLLEAQKEGEPDAEQEKTDDNDDPTEAKPACAGCDVEADGNGRCRPGNIGGDIEEKEVVIGRRPFGHGEIIHSCYAVQTTKV